MNKRERELRREIEATKRAIKIKQRSWRTAWLVLILGLIMLLSGIGFSILNLFVAVELGGLIGGFIPGGLFVALGGLIWQQLFDHGTKFAMMTPVIRTQVGSAYNPGWATVEKVEVTNRFQVKDLQAHLDTLEDQLQDLLDEQLQTLLQS